jgi:uncharacterized protein with ATP-grasp and redox domains
VTDEEKAAADKKVKELEEQIAAEKKLKADLEAKLKEPPDEPDPFPELREHDEKIAKLEAELEAVKTKAGKTSWVEWILLAVIGFIVVAGVVGELVRRRRPPAPSYGEES